MINPNNSSDIFLIDVIARLVVVKRGFTTAFYDYEQFEHIVYLFSLFWYMTEISVSYPLIVRPVIWFAKPRSQNLNSMCRE